MKKFLLLLSSVFAISANAQCPVTVNGQSSGGNVSMCQGACIALIANGAQTYSWSPGGVTSSNFTVCPSTTSTYTVYSTSNGGLCFDTCTITVNVTPLPNITVTASSGTVCAGNSATLTASGATSYTWGPNTGFATASSVVVYPTNPTCYTVTGTDFMGCMNSTVFCLQTNPSVSFSMTNVSPQVWSAVPVYTGTNTPFTYDWDWGDGSSHATTAYPSHTYSVAAWYAVCITLTDGSGCTANYCEADSLYKMSGSMISLNIVTSTNGIIEHNHGTQSFYPNPATDQVQFSENISVAEFYDISGKLVLSRKLTGKSAVSVSALPEGIYFIRMKVGEIWLSKKLVITR